MWFSDEIKVTDTSVWCFFSLLPPQNLPSFIFYFFWQTTNNNNKQQQQPLESILKTTFQAVHHKKNTRTTGNSIHFISDWTCLNENLIQTLFGKFSMSRSAVRPYPEFFTPVKMSRSRHTTFSLFTTIPFKFFRHSPSVNYYYYYRFFFSFFLLNEKLLFTIEYFI